MPTELLVTDRWDYLETTKKGDLLPEEREGANAGSVVVTKDTIFIGAGYFNEEVIGSPLSVTVAKLYAAKEISAGVNDAGDTHPEMLRTAIGELYGLFPNIEYLTISAFASFKLLRKANQEKDGYGVFTRPPLYPAWHNKDLYKITLEAIQGVKPGFDPTKKEDRSKILIAVDVSAAAVGEHFWELRYSGRRPDECAKLENYSTVYVKVSNSVNAGFTSSGWIGRGMSHANMSHGLPRRRLERELGDDYPGLCRAHGDCYHGLITVSAVLDRARRVHGANIGSVAEIPEDSIVWIFAADYIAQLCKETINLLSPRRIALGGQVLRGPFPDSRRLRAGDQKHAAAVAWRAEFIAKIRRVLDWSLTGHNPDGELPRYEALKDLDALLQYRACRYPGVFGGILISRWNKMGRSGVGGRENP